MADIEKERILMPCPFCGHDAPRFERTGTSRQSCIVECGMCGARHESSDEYARSGNSWNTRALPPADAAEARMHAKQLDEVAYQCDLEGLTRCANACNEAAALLRRMAGEK